MGSSCCTWRPSWPTSPRRLATAARAAMRSGDHEEADDGEPIARPRAATCGHGPRRANSPRSAVDDVEGLSSSVEERLGRLLEGLRREQQELGRRLEAAESATVLTQRFLGDPSGLLAPEEFLGYVSDFVAGLGQASLGARERLRVASERHG
mmetsp:Transcript_180831/g.573984  ORF Transcript_180831/g.573984 Transcript_180831/m.573984 type:complete len:152 (+) Transcript_180831:1037-1492(+)